jgi:hypothetical protein
MVYCWHRGKLELPNRGDVNRLLADGVAAARAGQRAQACNLLLDVVEFDQRNELAWLWLSAVTDDLSDQRICLENVLTINPKNTLARKRLAALPPKGAQPGSAPSTVVICPQCGAGNRDFVRECSACGYALFARCPVCGEFNPNDAQTCDRCKSPLTPASTTTDQSSKQLAPALAGIPVVSRPPTPVTLWPVVAFWVSASLFFIGGGMFSLLRFVDILVYARGMIQNLSGIEIAWLFMALFFTLLGLTGFGLAWQLARRRPGGYYGSLLLGLVLALLGPSAGLILEPPKYLAIACMGLTPAAVILLTLANMADFESQADTS